jgi:hypothetical protein
MLLARGNGVFGGTGDDRDGMINAHDMMNAHLKQYALRSRSVPSCGKSPAELKFTLPYRKIFSLIL